MRFGLSRKALRLVFLLRLAPRTFRHCRHGLKHPAKAPSSFSLLQKSNNWLSAAAFPMPPAVFLVAWAVVSFKASPQFQSALIDFGSFSTDMHSLFDSLCNHGLLHLHGALTRAWHFSLELTRMTFTENR